MGNPFFDFFKYWPKLFKKKKIRIEIWNENVHISILNFFFKEFWPIFKKVKK